MQNIWDPGNIQRTLNIQLITRTHVWNLESLFFKFPKTSTIKCLSSWILKTSSIIQSHLTLGSNPFGTNIYWLSANPEPVELAFVAFVALAVLAQSRSNLTIQSTFTIRKKTSHISKNPLKNLPGEFWMISSWSFLFWKKCIKRKPRTIREVQKWLGTGLGDDGSTERTWATNRKSTAHDERSSTMKTTQVLHTSSCHHVTWFLLYT